MVVIEYWLTTNCTGDCTEQEVDCINIIVIAPELPPDINTSDSVDNDNNDNNHRHSNTSQECSFNKIIVAI